MTNLPPNHIPFAAFDCADMVTLCEVSLNMYKTECSCDNCFVALLFNCLNGYGILEAEQRAEFVGHVLNASCPPEFAGFIRGVMKQPSSPMMFDSDRLSHLQDLRVRFKLFGVNMGCNTRNNPQTKRVLDKFNSFLSILNDYEL